MYLKNLLQGVHQCSMWITMVLLCIPCFAHAIDNVTLFFTPDEFPADISWSLQDENYKVIASNNLASCTPRETCINSFLIQDKKCYRLIIEDSQVDTASWQLMVTINLDTVISEMITDSLIIYTFGCEAGYACEVPKVFSPDIETMMWPEVEQYWFSYTPRNTGLYEINNCDLKLSNRRYPGTSMWIYQDCLREVTDGPEGAIAFSEKYSFCPPSSGFSVIPLEAGTEYLIRVKYVPTFGWSDSINLNIRQFLSNPGCTDPDACNYYPFATEDDGSCYYDGCQPDLEIDQQVFESSIVLDSIEKTDGCLIEEGCLRGPGLRHIVRFSTLIKNVGNADYIIGSPEVNEANFSDDNCHQHFHHLGYAEYLLFADAGEREPIGFKNGFCVQDSECPTGAQRYFCSYMGITAGCQDLYGNNIDCQWVDVTDVPDGDYTLVARVNWSRLPDIRGYQELSYDNNWAQSCINIDRSSGSIKMTILPECTAYTDCLGKPFGQAEIDCNGICGGTEHYGDLNQSGEIDMDDVDEYISQISAGSMSPESCFDLDADGDISIYDALLARACAVDNEANKDNLFHKHCPLPAGQFTDLDSLRLEITAIDPAAKTIELSYLSMQSDIIGFQISLDGVKLSREQRIDKASYHYADDKLIGQLAEQALSRNLQMQAFLTLSYDTINADSICISKLEGINSQYQEIFAYSASDCAFLTPTVETLDDLGISYYPNPADSYLIVESGEVTIESVSMYDLLGRPYQIDTVQQRGKESILDVSRLPEGLYIMAIISQDARTYTAKVLIH